MLGLHFKGFLAAIVLGAIAGLATVIGAGHVQVGWVVVAVVVGITAMLLVGFIKRMSTTYTITNHRLTIDIGLLSRDMHQARLERVQNVSSRQTLGERILRIGTVDFDTAGEHGFDFTFSGVAHPREIVRTVDHALRELREAAIAPDYGALGQP